MSNRKQLIYRDDARAAVLGTNPSAAHCIDRVKVVDVIEVSRVKEAKKEILNKMEEFYREYRRISESYVDHFGGKADAMQIAMRIVDATLTDLCF